MNKLNKIQKDRLNFLLGRLEVSNYHRILFLGIKGNNFKNVSIADNTLLVDLFNKYKWVKE